MYQPTIFLNVWILEETEKAYKFALIEDNQVIVWLPKSMIITIHKEEDKTYSIEILEWQAIAKTLI